MVAVFLLVLCLSSLWKYLSNMHVICWIKSIINWARCAVCICCLIPFLFLRPIHYYEVVHSLKLWEIETNLLPLSRLDTIHISTQVIISHWELEPIYSLGIGTNLLPLSAIDAIHISKYVRNSSNTIGAVSLHSSWYRQNHLLPPVM